MPRYSTKLKPKSNKKPGMLPLWLALAGLTLVIAAVWGVVAGGSQGNANVEVKGAPRLKVEKEMIDRGNVKLGTPLRDDIRVTNVGDQPLRFIEAPYVEVKEGC